MAAVRKYTVKKIFFLFISTVTTSIRKQLNTSIHLSSTSNIDTHTYSSEYIKTSVTKPKITNINTIHIKKAGTITQVITDNTTPRNAYITDSEVMHTPTVNYTRNAFSSVINHVNRDHAQYIT
jgi:hypothetical protein